MKRKPDTHTAIRRLHDAAQDIVQGFRGVSADVFKTPQTNSEVRIPILMQGTDMRVTIEAGPSVVMRNAIELAAMKASDKPYREPDADAKQEAVALLAIYAMEVKDANACADGKWMDAEDERHFVRIVAAMKALEVAA